MTYEYTHVVADRVVDGDTVVLAIDLGNKIVWSDTFRLKGIDTPERGQPGYREAATRLTELIAHGIARVQTFKPDKYGRWLVDIYVGGDCGGEVLVNTKLVLEGHARVYDGGKK